MTSLFPAQVALLQAIIGRRVASVARIERMLNCQKTPLEYQQDFALLSRQFNACFDAPGASTDTHASLGEQLERAHWASGFKPRAHPGNDLVDPVEQMRRAFHLWRQTRWPGQNGREHFAHTLFNLQVVRSLALLCMRLWDDADAGVPGRLAQLQDVLDRLWQGAPPEQPTLVRDVRWLFPVAMSPTTDSLAGYFEVAARIAETFTEEDRIETQKAWVQTGAGHLRSQLRDLALRRNLPVDADELVLLTRLSNALDVALLMEGLVTLLDAYERCVQRGDAGRRRELAYAICQGMSPDPELFVNRLDLLGPYTMIEQLFVTTDASGAAVYTQMGQRHLALLRQYKVLVARLAQPLCEDCRQNRPADHAYSPYGVLYGFASNLLELTAFKTLQREAATQFSIEDAFTNGAADKLAWVNGWRNLPHVKPELAKQYEYPQQFAEEIGARVERALQRRVSAADADAITGRIFIVLEQERMQSPPAQLATPFIVASDPQLVAAGKAQAKVEDDLLHCRNEGEFLVSYPTGAGWAALTKDLLTGILGAGRDAQITDLPRTAADVLRLMCPDVVVMQ